MYEVVQFGKTFDDDLTGHLSSLDKLGVNLHVWIAAPGSPLVVGAELNDCQLYPEGAEPSEANPLHIGVSDSAHPFGGSGNDFATLERIYSFYGIEFDAAQFAVLKADPRYYSQQWRLTDLPSGDLAEWVEDAIYGPNGVAPFRNDQGEISPFPVRMPYGVDPNTIPEFGDNVIEIPTPELSDPQNRCRFDWEELEFPHFRAGLFGHGYAHEPEGDLGGDLIARRRRSVTVEHDNVGQVGGELVKYDLSGIASPNEGRGPEVVFLPTLTLPFARSTIAAELFDRQGDGRSWGPLVTHLRVPDSAGNIPEDVYPGQLVRINLASVPNPQLNARGGQRVVTITGRRPVEGGLEFMYEDAGPSLQPVPQPTVVIALDPTDPKHAVEVTVSGVAPGTTASVELFLAGGGVNRAYEGKGNGTFVVRGLPSNTLVRVRAAGAAPNRIRSLWTAEQSITTQELSAPTITGSAVDGYSVRLEFSNNEPGYRIAPVEALAGGTLTPVAQMPLPQGSTFYTFHQDSPATSYDLGVRAIDEFGGVSAASFVTIATGAAAVELPEPRRVQVRQGRPTDAAGGELPPPDQWIGTGIELTWVNAALSAFTLWEVSTDLAFGTIEDEVQFDPGAEAGYFSELPLDDQVRYLRPRHVRPGNAPSIYGEIVAAKPTALLGPVESDSFAGGFITLVEREDDTVGAVVGSGDVDTERVYYAVRVNDSANPFAPVDESSPHVSRDGSPPAHAAFPFTGQLLDGQAGNPIDVVDGDLVTVHARFWNPIRGWGQETFESIVIGQPLGNGIDIINADWVAKEYLGPGPFLDSGDYYLDLEWVPFSQVKSIQVKSVGKTSDLFGVETTEYVTDDLTSPHRVAHNNGTSPRLFDGSEVHRVEITTYTGLGGTGAASEVRDMLLRDPHQKKGLTASQPGGGRVNRPYLAGTGALQIDVSNGALATVAQADAYGASSVALDYEDGAVQVVALAAAETLPVPSNLTSGRTMLVRVITNGHALTLHGDIEGPAPPSAAVVLVSIGNFDGQVSAICGTLAP